jgi:hypothetical protein
MWKCMCIALSYQQLVNLSISALAKRKSAVINPVAVVVLAEEPGMKKRVVQPDRAIHYPLPHCQIVPLKLVIETTYGGSCHV